MKEQQESRARDSTAFLMRSAIPLVAAATETPLVALGWCSSRGSVIGRGKNGVRNGDSALLYHMVIRLDTHSLTSEQCKFLSGLGEFLDGDIWESSCEAEDWLEALDWIAAAGIRREDIQVRWGQSWGQ